MPRPLVAITDVRALRANLAVARAAVPQAKIWAVVKADAYGHGLDAALQGFAQADGLSLIEWDAAVRLRESGWQKPILMLEGLFEPADLAVAERHRLAVVVHHDAQLSMLEAARLSSPLDIHLKINTGMNRLGFSPDRVRAAYARLRAMPAVQSIAFMTHFANAEQPGAVLSADSQFARFREATAGLDGLISVANSAATLMQPRLHADWIRPGVMLYGASPGGGSAASFGLRPAMQLESKVMAVQTLAAGAMVGYGSLFTAESPMRIGIVACGYADGYPRSAPTGTPVLVNGVRCRLIGRVSMDMITVDLAPVPTAEVGSQVTLWGDGLPVDEVAAAAGTIGYELLCALTPRVQRRVRN
jgi:alanine racemase